MGLLTLYKYNNNGKIQAFKLTVEVDDSTFPKAYIVRNWGELGSNLQTKRTEVKGKNLGRTNATSPFTQSTKECISLWRKKKSEGYTTVFDLSDGKVEKDDLSPEDLRTYLENNLTKSQLDGSGRVKPMLLYEARTATFPLDEVLRNKAKRKDVKFPVIVDYKRDGVCTIASPGDSKGSNGCVLSTRSGKDRHTPKGQKWDDIVPHLVEQLHYVWNVLEEAGYELHSFHGETYKHGLTLQEIQKANKKINKDSSSMDLYIFDIVDEELNMGERRSLMLNYKAVVLKHANAPNIHFIIGELVENATEVFEIETMALDAGYEGLVLRHLNGMYKIGGRSTDVLKMVRMDKMEVEVIGIIPMDKAPDMGKFVCAYGGQEFLVTPGKGYNHELRRKLLLNKNDWKSKGRTIIIYHRGFTDGGIPRIATAPKPK